MRNTQGHQRNRDCQKRDRFKTEGDAWFAVGIIRANTGADNVPFLCPFCREWHLEKRRVKNKKRHGNLGL